MKLTAESTVLDDKKITESFATLQVDADGIRTEVGKKVGNDEVISRINQSPELIQIQANKVAITGTTIFNAVNSDASVKAAMLNSEVKGCTFTLMASNTSGATYATILGYAAEGRLENWNVISTNGVKAGDTVRIGYYVSDMSMAVVYVVATVTQVFSATYLGAISHGLDTTIIDGGNIITNSIGANQIATNAVTADKINANAVTADKIAANAVTAVKLDATTINASNKLTVGAMQTAEQDKILNSKMNIGGRNLLANACFATSYIGNYASYISQSFTYYAQWAVQLVTASWLRANLEPSTQYTISFDYEVVSIESGITDARSQGIIASANLGGLSIGIDVSHRVAGYKTHCEQTWTTPSSMSSAIMYWYTFYSNSKARACNDTIRITNLKIEKGNKVTAWSAADEDLAATATSYITDIGSDGIRVHDSHTPNNSVVINSGGMKVYKGGTADANCIAEYSDSVRIGKPTSTGAGNVLIDDDSVDIRKGSTVLATFGADGLRIGKDNEKHIEVKSNAFNVYDEDGSAPFSVSTAGSLQSVTRNSSSAMSPSSGSYPSWHWSICLNGTITDNKIYFGVSTSGFPTSYTNYITLPSNPTTFPTTLQSITVSGVTCSARWQTRSTIYVQFQNTTSNRVYAGYRCTDNYYETTVKVNDANLKIESSMALLKDRTGASVDSNCYVRTYGHVAMLSLAVYNTSTISAGGLIYSGDLASFLPVISTRLIGQYRADKPVVGHISSGGTIELYNSIGASVTSSSSSPITLTATYIFV